MSPSGDIDAVAYSQNENTTDGPAGNTAFNNESESAGSQSTYNRSNYPHFHVTYWMFYPYSQVEVQFTRYITSS